MKNLKKKISFIGLFLFIALVGLLFINKNSNPTAKVKASQKQVYVKMEVKGMVCSFCANRMETKLRKSSGVNNAKVDLKNGLAYITTTKSKKPAKENLKEIITNTGFKPGKIEYSNKPFVIEKNTPKNEKN